MTATVTLKIDGVGSFSKWTGVNIERDVKQISGGFSLDYDDEGRAAAALPNLIAAPPFFRAIQRGMPFELALDGETVMIGWIGEIQIGWKAGGLSATLRGRDKTGDLVDCAALPRSAACRANRLRPIRHQRAGGDRRRRGVRTVGGGAA